MLRKLLFIMLFVLCGNIAAAVAQAMPDPPRGELLYSTHCIACHTTQIHWRDKKLAKDYPSLVAEVGRWQKLAGLGWNDDDISAVAHHLNTLFYRYPVP
jgi:mono/diheme cytochrome c family protein